MGTMIMCILFRENIVQNSTWKVELKMSKSSLVRILQIIIVLWKEYRKFIYVFIYSNSVGGQAKPS